MDTPAWQSFEMRMRARAAEHREAKRRRRLRRLKYATGGVLALVLGMVSAVVVGEIDRRATREPIVVEWPPLPDPPPTRKMVEMGALPLPAGWEGSDTSEGDRPQTTPGQDATEPAPASEHAVQSAPIARVQPPSGTPAERGAPRGGSASPLASVAPPQDRPVDPTGGIARRNQSAEPPLGTSQRNRPLEPPVGTNQRNQPVEPTGGTLVRNQPLEPPVGTNQRNQLVEPTGGTVARNPPAEPTVGTSLRNQPVEPPVGTSQRNPVEPAPRLEPVRPPETPPAARSSVPPVVAAPRIDPRESVQATLERYRTAYQRLDASAARAVWPSVDAGALTRAFGSLASQELWFEGCRIDVSGSAADATCTGQSRVVPKIGGGSETARRTWQFKLRQSGRDWVIEKATVK